MTPLLLEVPNIIPSIGHPGDRFRPRSSEGQNRIAVFYKGYPVGWKGLPYEHAIIEGVISGWNNH